MKTTFRVRDKEYELTLSRREPGEEDKFHLFAAIVSGQPGGPVTGQLQLTDEAIKKAEEQDSPERALARACARSLASEVLIRKLEPDFSFVVDHRWL